MRKVDHSKLSKHISATDKIQPCCKSKYVFCLGRDVQTIRLFIYWRGYRIRTGIALGEVIDGEPYLSETGMLCLTQWLRGEGKEHIVFAEFSKGATGNTERMRSLLIKRLDKIVDEWSATNDPVLMIVAKNTVMYDKLFRLIKPEADYIRDPRA